MLTFFYSPGSSDIPGGGGGDSDGASIIVAGSAAETIADAIEKLSALCLVTMGNNTRCGNVNLAGTCISAQH